jgi:hypothetical protein
MEIRYGKILLFRSWPKERPGEPLVNINENTSGGSSYHRAAGRGRVKEFNNIRCYIEAEGTKERSKRSTPNKGARKRTDGRPAGAAKTTQA